MVQAQVREALAQQQIDYKVKTIDYRRSAAGSGGGREYTAQNALSTACEYIIYVKKDDFERAGYLINSGNKSGRTI